FSLLAEVRRASATIKTPSHFFAKMTASLEVRTAGPSITTNAFSLKRFKTADILDEDSSPESESTTGPLGSIVRSGSSVFCKASKRGVVSTFPLPVSIELRPGLLDKPTLFDRLKTL